MSGSACSTLGLKPSFGFGDRIGLATPGHIRAMERSGHGVAPIFPQQSIREMSRTRRTPRQVMEDACRAAESLGWNQPMGADADHLKTNEDVERTAEAGFTFFTIDPSDHVDEQADGYDLGQLREKVAALDPSVSWMENYQGQQIQLDGDTQIEFSEEACLRAAAKYGPAIEHACQLAGHIAQTCGGLDSDYEIELSVDETPHPTSLAEHYIIADQCLQRGMKLVSLAPRFIGDFEKGIDFKGDVEELERSLNRHAAIARALGPYKLSLHSGSDKLSMYASLARATQGRWHVKTAGTSYLEALRVAARHDVPLLRRIVTFSRERFEQDKATYHISAKLSDVPPPEEISDDETLEEAYLGLWRNVPAGEGFTNPGRQIVHCTFGSVLTDAALGTLLRQLLEAHQDTYTEVLAEHFIRHLDALQAGMPTQ